MRTNDWSPWLELGIGVGYVLGGIGVFSDVYRRMSISDWASWVQAVGSIGAIAAGFAWVTFQLRHQERMATEVQLQEEIDCAALLWVAAVTIRASKGSGSSSRGRRTPCAHATS